MSPITHLLASWLVGASTTRQVRDCRLVTLAGVLPDLDGLGVVVDIAGEKLGWPTDLYATYHHFLLHGVAGSLIVAAVLAALSLERRRVFLLAFAVFHLHLFCDLIGARGPTPADIWTVPYLGPFSHAWEFSWSGQWPLNGWPNKVITYILMALALWLPTRIGHSVVGVFNRRADAAVVEALRRWRGALTPRRTCDDR